MELTPENMFDHMDEILDEMEDLVGQLRQIEQDNPATHPDLLRIFGRIAGLVKPFENNMLFIQEQGESVDTIRDRLDRFTDLATDIAMEKDRIDDNTPPFIQQLNNTILPN